MYKDPVWVNNFVLDPANPDRRFILSTRIRRFKIEVGSFPDMVALSDTERELAFKDNARILFELLDNIPGGTFDRLFELLKKDKFFKRKLKLNKLKPNDTPIIQN